MERFFVLYLEKLLQEGAPSAAGQSQSVTPCHSCVTLLYQRVRSARAVAERQVWHAALYVLWHKTPPLIHFVSRLLNGHGGR